MHRTLSRPGLDGDIRTRRASSVSEVQSGTSLSQLRGANSTNQLGRHARNSCSRYTIVPAELSKSLLLRATQALLQSAMQQASGAAPVTPRGKIAGAKLERALQLKDRCDRDLQAFYESKRSRHRPRSSRDNHGELLLLEQDKPNENLIRDKRELERLLRKLSPTISNFASTHAEFVHLLQMCSTCSNRIAFCPTCTEKAVEFFSGYTSTELFSLYGVDLPPANEAELASFDVAVAAREARAIREDHAESCAPELK